MTYKEKTAERLLKLRLENGLTQKELAERVDTSPQNIDLYESGKRKINVEILGKIADVFNVSVDYLLGRTEIATMNEDIKAVCKFTGLSENAAKLLNIETKSDDMRKVINFIIVRSGLQYTLKNFFTAPDGDIEIIRITKDGQIIEPTIWVEEGSTDFSTGDILRKVLFDRVCDNVKQAKKLFDKMYRNGVEDNGKHNTPKE